MTAWTKIARVMMILTRMATFSNRMPLVEPIVMMTTRQHTLVRGRLGTMALTKIALAYTDRSALHRVLAARFKTMLDEGLVAEVEDLRRLPGVKKDSVAMRSVGYRQVWRYLDGEIDCAGMCAEAIAATRQLAKRQLTWLRRSGGVVWFSANEPGVSEVIATYTAAKLSLWLQQLKHRR